jgi:uncharacterized membrane protein YczE
MKEKPLSIRILVYSLGILLTSLGLALIIKSEMGAANWTALNFYLSKLIGLTVGIWTYLTATVVYLLSSYFDKKWKNPLSVLTIFFIGSALDLWNMVVSGIVLNGILSYLLGLLLFCLGVAVNIKSTLPPAPYEQLPLVLSKKYNVSFIFTKIGIEFIAISFAVVVGLVYGNVFEQIYFGTFVFVFALGPIITFFMKWI